MSLKQIYYSSKSDTLNITRKLNCILLLKSIELVRMSHYLHFIKINRYRAGVTCQQTPCLPAEIRRAFVSESVKVTLDFSVVKGNKQV